MLNIALELTVSSCYNVVSALGTRTQDLLIRIQRALPWPGRCSFHWGRAALGREALSLLGQDRGQQLAQAIRTMRVVRRGRSSGRHRPPERPCPINVPGQTRMRHYPLPLISGSRVRILAHHHDFNHLDPLARSL